MTLALLSNFAAGWWSWVWPAFWQSAVLIGLVAVLDWVLGRRLDARLRLALWSLVILKLALPPELRAPTSLSAGWFDDSGVPLLVLGVAHTIDMALGGGESLQSFLIALSNQRGAVHVALYAAAMVWLAGVIAIAVLYMLRWQSMARLIQLERAKTQAPRWLTDMLADATATVGLRRAPLLAITDKLTVPAVFGLMKPTVLIPEQALATLPRQALRHILLHELAHIRRKDLWHHLAFIVVQALHWFNPLVHLVRRRVTDARELACDAAVVRMLNTGTEEYRQTLLQTARLTMQADLQLPRSAAVCMVDRPSALIERVEVLGPRVAGRPNRLRNLLGLLALAGACLGIAPMGRAEWVSQCKPRTLLPAEAPDYGEASS